MIGWPYGVGAVSGSVVFFSDFSGFSDFLVFGLGDSVVLSSAASFFGDFSVLASDFFEVLLVESALLFFSFVLFGEEALSGAGLLVVAGFEGEVAVGAIGVGFGVVMATAVPLALGAAETAGGADGATLAAGAAVALVDALALVVVVVPLVLVLVTPMLKLGVTP